MARPKRSGLNVVRKRRIDGSYIDYFYDRQTGRPLGHDREAALREIRVSEAAGVPATASEYVPLLPMFTQAFGLAAWLKSVIDCNIPLPGHVMLIERKSTLHTGTEVTDKTRSIAEQLRPV